MNDENHLYEYSVIRYVPAVEREEFVNIGLVMMCKRMRWIKMQLHMPDSKIRVFRSELPMDALHHQATSLSLIADAGSRLYVARASRPLGHIPALLRILIKNLIEYFRNR